MGINGNIDGIGDKVNATFGASIGFHNVKKLTEGSAHSLTQAEASCCAYQAEMFEFINFLLQLTQALEDADRRSQHRFMGGISNKAYENLTPQEIRDLRVVFDTFDAF